MHIDELSLDVSLQPILLRATATYQQPERRDGSANAKKYLPTDSIEPVIVSPFLFE